MTRHRPISCAAAAVAALVLLAGCAAPRPTGAAAPFSFARDTFAFPNQTHWVYTPNPATGRMDRADREPPPDFAHRCFVVVRAAKEFHLHARFDPSQPPASTEATRRHVRTIIGRSSRRPSPEDRKVVIPGFADLRTFSAAHEALLKEEVGGAWQSYAQRGHWRMLFPFTGATRAAIAQKLVERVADGSPAVLHVIEFPKLGINHAVLVYHAEPTPGGYRFEAYDPNDASAPIELTYDRATRRFRMPPTPYYLGGDVNLYEVYRSAWY